MSAAERGPAAGSPGPASKTNDLFPIVLCGQPLLKPLQSRHPAWSGRIIPIESWWRGDPIMRKAARYVLVFPYGPIDVGAQDEGDISHAASLLKVQLRAGATVIFLVPAEEGVHAGKWWTRLGTLASSTDDRVSVRVVRAPHSLEAHCVHPSTLEAYLTMAREPGFVLDWAVSEGREPEVIVLAGFGTRAPTAVRWKVGEGEIVVVPLPSFETPTGDLELLLGYDYRILVEEAESKEGKDVRIWINGEWFKIPPYWADRLGALYARYLKGEKLDKPPGDSLAQIRRLRAFLEEKGFRLFPSTGKYRNVRLDPDKRIVLRQVVRPRGKPPTA